MPSISLDAGSTAFAKDKQLSRSIASNNGNCDLELYVTRESAFVGTAETPCVVKVTPRQVTGQGVAGNIAVEGDCGVLSLEWSVNVAGADSGATQSQDVGTTTAYGKITGDDFIGFDVFWHYTKVKWTHTSIAVLSGTQYVNGWRAPIGS